MPLCGKVVLGACSGLGSTVVNSTYVPRATAYTLAAAQVQFNPAALPAHVPLHAARFAPRRLPVGAGVWLVGLKSGINAEFDPSHRLLKEEEPWSRHAACLLALRGWAGCGQSLVATRAAAAKRV